MNIHSMLVHFPIGLILTGAVWELGNALFRPGNSQSSGSTMLALGTIGGLPAAAAGLWHAGGFAGSGEVAVHQWLALGGITATAAALASRRLWLREASRRLRFSYLAALATAVGLIAAAGYTGGHMAHGDADENGVERDGAPTHEHGARLEEAPKRAHS